MRRRGYKGLGATVNRKYKTAAVRSVYELLGGTEEGRMRRRNPTTGNLIGVFEETSSSSCSCSRKKKVVQVEDGVEIEIWDSAKQIEELTGGVFKASGVQRACREGKEYKGYEWRYI